jgi:hypothetical protein
VVDTGLLVIGSFGAVSFNQLLPKGWSLGNVTCFHASAGWLIPDAQIRERVCRVEDFLDDALIADIEDRKLCFLRDLERHNEGVQEKGVPLVHLLRYHVMRQYETFLEAYEVLRRIFQRYKILQVYCHPSCGLDRRTAAYANVLQTVFSGQIQLLHDDTGEHGAVSTGTTVTGKSYSRQFMCFLASVLLSVNAMIRTHGPTVYFCASLSQCGELLHALRRCGPFRIVFVNQELPMKSVPNFLRLGVQWMEIEGFDLRTDSLSVVELCSEWPIHFETSWMKEYFSDEPALMELMRRFIEINLAHNRHGLLRTIYRLERAFSQSSMLAVVCGEDQMPPGRAVVEMANHHGRSSYVICHAIHIMSTNFIFSARNVLTYGKKMREIIQRYCLQHHPIDRVPKVHEIGMPRLVRLKTLSAESVTRDVRLRLGVQAGRKLVLFVLGNMTLYPYFYLNYLCVQKQRCSVTVLRKLRSISEKRDDVHVVVKLKQGAKDTINSFADMWKVETGVAFSIVFQEDTTELVRASDLVCHAYSTVGYEAMLLGKPVVRFGMNDSFKNWEFVGTTAEVPVNWNITEEDMEKILLRLLLDEDVRAEQITKSREYLDTYHSREDLQVIERFMNLVIGTGKAGIA